MVAIVRGPSYYDPRRQPKRALERRNLVLKVLVDQGVVRPGRRGSGREITARHHGQCSGRSANYFPAFLDLVRRQLREDYQEQDLTESGLTVFIDARPAAAGKGGGRDRAGAGAPGQVGAQRRKGPRRVRRRHDAANGRSRCDGRRATRLVRWLQPRARHEAPDRIVGETAGVPGCTADRAIHASLARPRRTGRAEARRWQGSGSRTITTARSTARSRCCVR